MDIAGPITPEAADEQLNRILASESFQTTQQLSGFLRFIVEETLAGRSDQLKAYTIAVSVLGRKDNYDPQTDATVRILAGRLRARLDQYYSDSGRDDPVRICIPKGCYVPVFQVHSLSAQRNTSRGQATQHADGSDKPTVAVLPLVNLNGQPDDDYFALGLTEQLILNLSNFKELSVLPRYATMSYKDQPEGVGHIERMLGIRFVMEGSVQKVGQTMRVSVYLSDVLTQRQIWAEAYERPLSVENLLGVQDEIAQNVAITIGDIYGGVIPRVMKKEDQNRANWLSLTAYEALLRYTHFFCELTRETLLQAKEALDRAFENEPNNPEILAMLSNILRVGYGLGLQGGGDPSLEVLRMARRAVSLDPLSQMARASMAGACQLARDPAGMLREARALISIKPYGTHYALAGWTMALAGEWQQGLMVLREQMALLRYYPGWFHLASFIDQYRRAEYHAALREAHMMNTPTLLLDPMQRAAAFGQLGMRTQGQWAVAELLELCPVFPGDPRRYINWLIPFDDLVDHLLEGLRKAGLSVS
jgi:TolB-like protein